jgi:hypothetical protein
MYKISEQKNFVALQDYGFTCRNYYTGQGGKEIGLTNDILNSLGIENDSILVSPKIIPKLAAAEKALYEEGFGLVIKYGLITIETTKKIVELLEKNNPSKVNLPNQDNFPHATGMAINVTLADLTKDIHDKTLVVVGEELALNNGARDGVNSYLRNFYKSLSDIESLRYQTLQNILKSFFIGAGFRTGSRMTYGNFELPNIKFAPRC